ncbi:DUF2243 domain-containing protein [Sphingomonas xinjiangensis]|uniref:Putative membrane protein n=1 Tax=Sphingomonas xinjiangensis TaxID=643568 RepID=A0A840YIB3_9SPHN|nr:DUF2243 domain-containing protein [Sphingomonas xinjiangensis]MBB5710598.1 putative membrane protein [Sphingomonas xinjiangensis]
MTNAPSPTSPSRATNPTKAAFVIGLALSGFFDGILLHQVLQWHHFLSLVPGERFQDLRTQVLADGLFHVFVYALTALGLWLLWRARAGLDRPGAARRVAGGVLLGFGVWNLLDVGVFHWVLGIHRIRVNVENPLLYDLAWFILLGLVVAAIGWAVLRRASGNGPDSTATGSTSTTPSGRTAALAATAALLLSAPLASLPSDTGSTLVVFRPGTSTGTAINTVLASGSSLVALDPSGRFAVVKLPQRSATLALYRSGALFVTSSAALAGCLAFVERG